MEQKLLCRSSLVILMLMIGGYFNVMQASDAPSKIFDDLTTSEMKEVIDYLHSQPDLGLTPGNNDLKSSYLFQLETVNPSKKDALDFLDNDGPEPVKQAKAILYRGDLEPPVVQTVIIEPIPSPKSHTQYKNSKWQDIPFTARPPLNGLEIKHLDEAMERFLLVIDRILKEATGYSYVNCGNRCLSWGPAGPPHAHRGGHKMLVYMVRDVEGRYLHPIGLQFVIDMEKLDSSQWTVSYVSWQGQEFKNFEDMRRAYENGDLRTKVLPIPENVDNEKLPSSLNVRGTPRPEKPQRGRSCSMPDGDRFIVTGHHVAWLGWSFTFNFRTSIGIQLLDLKFLNERIVYELSLQELGVQYSGGDACSSHTLFFDSTAQIGYSGTELFKGIDCPYDARFFDSVHLMNGKPFVHKNTICMFEWNRGIPLRRHYESDLKGSFHYYQGMPDNVLIIRTIITVFNYDYIVDIMLHQDGKVEVKSSLTGYLANTFYQGPFQDKYGSVVYDNTIGNLHVHLINFKVDMDILGTDNRFVTLDIKGETIADSLNPGKTMFNRKFEKVLKKTEKEAALQFDFEKPKYTVFFNNDAKNKYGHSRGYRLHISDMGKLLLPPEYRSARSFAWAQYQMAVTRYDEEEQRSSSEYHFMDPYEAVFSLQDFIDDDQNIVDKDLVAWVTMTTHHIPHAEDVPIVTTPALQLTFYLLPYNFFDEDPSMASRDNIRVLPTDQETFIYQFSGDILEQECHHHDTKCQGIRIASSSQQALSPPLLLVYLLLALLVLC